MMAKNSSSNRSPRRQSALADRFSLARLAYLRRDVSMSRAAHTRAHLEHRLRANGLGGRFLADGVFGATDGIVTTFAVVAGAAGAYLSPAVVLIMGFANLIADGLSMSVGNYLGTRSMQDYWRQERRRESWEIEHLPDAEREEVRRLYQRKGFTGELLDRAVATITGEKDRWLDEMMREELGIQEEGVESLMSGLVTFGAFVVAGCLPLAFYVLAVWNPGAAPLAFPLSVTVTAAALFGVGAARSFMTLRPWWRSGLEVLAIGGTAAACAFAIGHWLRGLLG